MKEWTREEVLRAVKIIETHPKRLGAAFELAAWTIGRTPSAVKNAWYQPKGPLHPYKRTQGILMREQEESMLAACNTIATPEAIKTDIIKDEDIVVCYPSWIRRIFNWLFNYR